MGGIGIVVMFLAVSAIPFVALVLAIVALKRASDRRAPSIDEARLVELERRLRRLDERLRAVEPERAAPKAEAPIPVPARMSPPVPPPTPPTPPPVPSAAPAQKTLALETRIGARWATWVGVVSLIITVGLLLRWTFENNLIGPTGRVVLGLATGASLLAAGLLIRRAGTLPFLAEGLSGGGLAILYLSLYAANTMYGLLATGVTFALMSCVTVSGIAVAVASGRQTTAVLAVLGGLLTPILVATDRPDERVLMAYLIVLGALVLGVARRRSWIALNRLSWIGSMTLLVPTLFAHSVSPHPIARLALLTALGALFGAVPLVEAWMDRHPVATPDLGIVVANAAGYFAAIYLTLERWHPRLEAPWALSLGLVYVLVARLYKRRVPEDDTAVGVHLGNAIVLSALAFPLAFDGPTVTLAWAIEGAVLVWLAARRVDSKTALAGGLLLFLFAVLRVETIDVLRRAADRPVWNVVFAVHLLVVVALAVAGWVALPPPGGARGVSWKGDDLRMALWLAAAAVLTTLLWREPHGLWPAGLLLLFMLVLATLGRVQGDRAFLLATPAVAGVLFVRLFFEDAALARAAAGASLNAPLVLRLASCTGLALAGRLVAGPDATSRIDRLGRSLRGASGVALLVTLAVGWVLHQDIAIDAAQAAGLPEQARHLQWKLHVGLSVLFTLYAAAALAWGFVRDIALVRYGALALLGIVIVKVFMVDLAELQAIYRILSFLVLGLVLLGVSYVYQRLRPEGSGGATG